MSATRRFNWDCRRPAGFTLVELLVVIGIIALLISILPPALNKLNANGGFLNITGDKSQIGNMATIYDNTNDGRRLYFSRLER